MRRISKQRSNAGCEAERRRAGPVPPNMGEKGEGGGRRRGGGEGEGGVDFSTVQVTNMAQLHSVVFEDYHKSCY